MPESSILDLFNRLRVWKKADERAPHKPLLVLYALGRWYQNNQDDIPFSEVDTEFRHLLEQFGPERAVVHPEYPFWRLQNDDVWSVNLEGTPIESNTPEPPSSVLKQYNVSGGFSEDVKAALRADPSLVTTIAHLLVRKHFQKSDFSTILAAVGLPTTQE